MKNLLAFLGACIVVFLVLGWYLDWYKLTPQKSNPGHTGIGVDVDRDKISSDVQKGVQKGTEKIKDLLDKKPAETAPKATAPETRPPG